MPLSKGVQDAVNEIRRNVSLTKSLRAERDLWRDKAMSLQATLDEMSAKESLSDEDRKALADEVRALDELNDQLEGAAAANIKPDADAGSAGSSSSGDQAAAAIKEKQDADREEQERVSKLSPEEFAEDRGRQKEEAQANRPDTVDSVLSNAPAVAGAPLMPNMAFNPAGSSPAPMGGDAGQPEQPAAIETAGGFVMAGGGGTARAPGSSPESPSSSLVIPEDPTAKAPASTADLVKSGLGDSRGNEMIGNDGKPASEVAAQQEPTADAVAREQERAKLLAEEQERRAANPLNLSKEDQEKREDAAKPMTDTGNAGPNEPPASPAS